MVWKYCECERTLVNTVLQGKVEGKGERGRPATQWLDVVKQWTWMRLNNTWRERMDRDAWRKRVSRAAPAQ